MKIVILTGATSSSVFGGSIGGPDDDGDHTADYLHGEAGRAYVEDADVIVAVWPPSKEPIICRAPEGVEIQALNQAWAPEGYRDAQPHPAITEEEYRERMRAEHATLRGD